MSQLCVCCRMGDLPRAPSFRADLTSVCDRLVLDTSERDDRYGALSRHHRPAKGLFIGGRSRPAGWIRRKVVQSAGRGLSADLFRSPKFRQIRGGRTRSSGLGILLIAALISTMEAAERKSGSSWVSNPVSKAVRSPLARRQAFEQSSVNRPTLHIHFPFLMLVELEIDIKVTRKSQESLPEPHFFISGRPRGYM